MSVSVRKPVSRRLSPLTPDEFSLALEPLRPHLIAYICRARPCGLQDAEDLLQDGIVDGLLSLASYDPGTGKTGLVSWMKEVIMLIILRDRRATAKQPDTVPLVHGLAVPANPSNALFDAVRSSLCVLAPEVYGVVVDHLDGYQQQEIAFRNRIHRNTVKNRMDLAAETLRCTFPSFQGFLDLALFWECSQHVKYTKQNDMAQWWANHHPPERHPQRRQQWEEDEIRPSLLRDLYCPDPLLLGAKRRVDAQRDRRDAVKKRTGKAVAA